MGELRLGGRGVKCAQADDREQPEQQQAGATVDAIGDGRLACHSLVLLSDAATRAAGRVTVLVLPSRLPPHALAVTPDQASLAFRWRRRSDFGFRRSCRECLIGSLFRPDVVRRHDSEVIGGRRSQTHDVGAGGDRSGSGADCRTRRGRAIGKGSAIFEANGRRTKARGDKGVQLRAHAAERRGGLRDHFGNVLRGECLVRPVRDAAEVDCQGAVVVTGATP